MSGNITHGFYIKLLTLSAILLLPSIARCKTQAVQGQWTNREMKISGDLAAWDGMPNVYFKESHTSLELCNDSDNLYVLVRFTDPMWVRTIKVSGLTLWLDAQGKKSKKLGICYKGGPTREEMQKMRQGEGGMGNFGENRENQRRDQSGMARNFPEQFLFIDKDNPEGIIIPVNGSRGPSVSYAVSEGSCAYEISIPLKSGNPGTYSIDFAPGQSFSLGAAWGDMSDFKNMMKERGGSRGGSMGEGDEGEGMRGGDRGGMRGGMGGARPEMPKKQEVWIKTQLAAPPQ